MCKHVDLIAIGVLLLVFAFAGHVHQAFYLHFTHPSVFRVKPPGHFVIVPPLPRLPRV